MKKVTITVDSHWSDSADVDEFVAVLKNHWSNRGLMAWEEVLTDEDMKTLGLTPDPDFDRSVFDMELRLRTTAI